MQYKYLKTFTALFALGTILTSCGDNKTALPGYIGEDELNEIVSKFKSTNIYEHYSVKGSLNYFAYSEDLVPNTVNRSNVKFNDDLEKYNTSSSSYYLQVPLHLTPQNWVCEEENSQGLPLATKYQLEAKIYRPAGLDKIYYYRSDNDGFICRVFGANKELIVKNPSDIRCHGKWDIEIEYNSDGYLVREKFATINASENNKSESCYGEATYTFSE